MGYLDVCTLGLYKLLIDVRTLCPHFVDFWVELRGTVAHLERVGGWVGGLD